MFAQKFKLLFYFLLFSQIFPCLKSQCLTLKEFEKKFPFSLGSNNLNSFFTQANFLGKGSNSIAFKIDWFVENKEKTQKINIQATARITDINILTDAQIQEEFSFHQSIFNKVGKCIPEPYACIIDKTAKLELLFNPRTNTNRFPRSEHMRIIIMDNGLGDLSSSKGDNNPVLDKFLKSGDKSIWSTFSEMSYCISLFHNHNIAHLDIKEANFILKYDNYDYEKQNYIGESRFRPMLIDFSDAVEFGKTAKSGSFLYGDQEYLMSRQDKKVFEDWPKNDTSDPRRDVYAFGMSLLYILLNRTDKSKVELFFEGDDYLNANKKILDFLFELKNSGKKLFKVKNDCFVSVLNGEVCFINVLILILQARRDNMVITAEDLSKIFQEFSLNLENAKLDRILI